SDWVPIHAGAVHRGRVRGAVHAVCVPLRHHLARADHRRSGSGGVRIDSAYPIIGVVRVLLVSTYAMGRKPFGLASPSACLRADGHEVTLADVSCSPMPRPAVESADLIAFFLPMHTATKLFLRLVDRVRAVNPSAHLAAYG